MDVFFLVDSSSSMDATIDGLADGIYDVANQLQASGVDAAFGLAEFQDAGTGGGDPGLRYRRRQDIAPLGDELLFQLKSMVTHEANDTSRTSPRSTRW